MIRQCCPDLNISDSQIGALVAAIDVSGDDLIQIEEFDAFLARSGNKMAARGTIWCHMCTDIQLTALCVCDHVTYRSAVAATILT